MMGLHDVGGHPRRWVILALAAKVVIIAAFVILPVELAVSVGAAHGVVLAVVASAVAVVLAVRRRRWLARPHHPGHGHPDGYHRVHVHGHESVAARNARLATEIGKDGKGA